MFNPIELCNKLARFHWSPKHPSEYVIGDAGRTGGIGKIAYSDYAAFNLAYTWCGGRLATWDEHTLAIQKFVEARIVLNTVVDGRELRDYALALTEAEFVVWYESNKHKLDKPIQSHLNAIFRPNGHATRQAI